MTAKAQGKIWDSDLPAEWKYICVALADQADDDGHCIYRDTTNNYLQKKLSLSESTVRRRLQELMRDDVGILIIVKPASQHRGPEYRIMFDRVKSYRSRGVKLTVQGCQPDTSEHNPRGVKLTGQGCQPDGQGCQPDGQGCQPDGSYIRCLDSPVPLDSPERTSAREEKIDEPEEPERQVTYAMGEHAFQTFKALYPKPGGKFLNEDLARIEFFKQPASWNMIIRGARNFSDSSIAHRAMQDSGKGLKFPNNFIRDGTWKDWQEPEDFTNTVSEDAMKAAKRELTAALIKSPEKMPELSDDAKRLFFSLKTKWWFLAAMATEGRDICGPQIKNDVVDGKMLAAEGSSIFS